MFSPLVFFGQCFRDAKGAIKVLSTPSMPGA